MTSRRFLVIVTLALGLPVGARAQDEVTYYHHDAAGSVRMITDAAAQVVVRYDYLPFGELLGTEPAGPNTIRFAGKERDAETAFEHFGARYYASQTGRFTTVDPVLDVEQALVDPQRWNRYTYVRNQPFRYVDPDGRAIETVWDLISLGTSARAVWQDPTSVWNWVSLGADVVSVVGPGIPAIGMAIRGGGRVDDAIDAARALDAANPQAARTAADALESQRSRLLRDVTDDDLRNVVEQLYRPGAKVGVGSSMDALRHERLTGELLSPAGHTKKLLDYRTNLLKLWDQRSRLNATDRRIVRDLLSDIQNALETPIP
jgi:RHS repeat-associated protein